AAEVNLKQIQKGSRSVNLIAESGLYKLVMRSDKHQAKDSQDWVTGVVLPAIRKDGYFNMTKAAKAFGKRLQHFMENRETQDYIREVSQLLNSRNSGDKDAVQVQRGNGNLPQVGTWGHPKLAVFFARWLDVR